MRRSAAFEASDDLLPRRDDRRWWRRRGPGWCRGRGRSAGNPQTELAAARDNRYHAYLVPRATSLESEQRTRLEAKVESPGRGLGLTVNLDRQIVEPRRAASRHQQAEGDIAGVGSDR